RIKEKGVELREIIRCEQAAVLAEGEIKMMFGAKTGEDVLGETGFVAAALDDRMLEAGGLGEEEDFFGARLRRAGQRPAGQAESQRCGSGAENHVASVHEWIGVGFIIKMDWRQYGLNPKLNKGRFQPRQEPVGRDSVEP